MENINNKQTIFPFLHIKRYNSVINTDMKFYA